MARRLLKSGIMDKPPLWIKLFLWMLLRANKTEGYNGLKVGEFYTNIREMREAMTFYVGYRKEEPSIKQIRGVYESLSGGTAGGIASGIEKMIDSEPLKGKRGLKISICNYEFYQNPKNYEGHSKKRSKKSSEGHSEKFTKDDCRAYLYSKQEEYNKRNNKRYKYLSPELLDFVIEFIFHIKDSKPESSPKITKTFLENSLKTVVDLIRLDGFDFEYIKSVLRFAVQDSFWQDNVFSLCPLRDVSKNGLKKFQNIATSYRKSLKAPGGSKRSQENARACADFVNEGVSNG